MSALCSIFLIAGAYTQATDVFIDCDPGPGPRSHDVFIYDTYQPYLWEPGIEVEVEREKSEAEKQQERRRLGKFFMCALAGGAFSYFHDVSIHGLENREYSTDFASRLGRIMGTSIISALPAFLITSISQCIGDALVTPEGAPSPDIGSYVGGFGYGVIWYLLNERFKQDPEFCIALFSAIGRSALRPPRNTIHIRRR